MCPFVSIIMVVYNGEMYLQKSLSAIAAQTFRDFELVFVNNGSTDNTETIFYDFRTENPSVTTNYVRISLNDGLPKGRNAGIDHACGTYLMFHDVDDWMDPDCLEVLADAAQVNPADRIIQSTRYINSTGTVRSELELTKNASRWSKNSLQGDLFLRKTIQDHHIRFSANAYFDDFYFTNQFCSYSMSSHIICESHYNMLLHNASMTHRFNGDPTYFIERLKNTFSEMQDIAERLTSKDEKAHYEYNCIQKYYTSVFGGINLSLKQKIQVYLAFKHIMQNYYPRYLSNDMVTLFAENGFYGSFKRNIWICTICEKIDNVLHIPLLMSAVLITYHIALKTGTYKY